MPSVDGFVLDSVQAMGKEPATMSIP